MKKIEKELVRDLHYLTPLQEGILFHYLEQPDGDQYFEQLCLSFGGKIDPIVFKQSWQLIIDHNDALRTVFRWNDLKKPLQMVLKQYQPEIVEFDLSKIDVNAFVKNVNVPEVVLQETKSLNSTHQLEKIIEQIKLDDKKRKFDFQDVPFRITLIRTEADSVALVTFHHILFDGWSTGIIIKEFLSVYQSLSAGVSPLFAPKSNLQAYLGVIQNYKENDEEFWQKYLLDYQGNSIATPERSNAVAGYKTFSLSKKETENMLKFCKETEITTAVFLYGVWGLTEGFYRNTSDIVIGTSVSGRDLPIPGIENTVGLFINSLPLRIKIDEELSSTDYLSSLQHSFNQWLQHGSSSITNIKKYCNIKGGSNIFDTFFVLDNYPLDVAINGDEKQALFIKSFQLEEATNYPLTITVSIFNQLQINVSYKRNLYSDELAAQLVGHFQRVMERVVFQPDSDIADIYRNLSEDCLQQYNHHNNLPLLYPKEKLIHQLFQEQVARTPDLNAIETSVENLSYFDLNKKANQIAWKLKKVGLQPGTIVGILIKPSTNLVVAVLGVLKAGGCYVPLDPSLPDNRIDYLVIDSNAKFILTDDAHAALRGYKGIIVNINEKNIWQNPSENHINATTPNDVVYIVYTSGSTGKPKGVLTTHDNLNSIMHSIESVVKYEPGKKILCTTAFTFDPFLMETLMPLIKGMTVVMANGEQQIDPDAIGHLMASHDISIMQATPSRLKLMLGSKIARKAIGKISKLMAGGEPLTSDLFEELRKCGAMQVYNLYGTTESTLFSTIQEIKDKNDITIGTPLPGTSVYIADRKGRVLPRGVFGEVYIGGSGIANGYHDRSDLTPKHFVPSLYNYGIVYRTGDLAKWNFRDKIEFHGRIDYQVKIRGFRIELSEIECIFKESGKVEDIAVVAKDFAPDDKRLVAYVAGDNSLLDQLKDFQEKYLPYYMRIAHFQFLKSLPVTHNGKTDRQSLSALPIENSDNPEAIENEASDIMLKIQNIWAEVLGIPNPGLNQNFFDLGGHSLLTIQVINKIRQKLGKDVGVVDLFKYTTIRSLSDFLTNKQEDTTNIAKEHKLKTQYLNKDIAVIGMAGRFPGARNIREFWENLKNGHESITFFSDKELQEEGIPVELLRNPGYVPAKGVLEEAEYFDGSFFGYSARECEIMDPQLRVLHECAWNALEDAGYDPSNYGGDIGMFAGSLTNTFWINSLSKRINDPTEEWEAENYNISVATPVSYKLNLRGPSIRVESACSTSLVAIHYACTSLLEGTSDMTVAGGVAVTFPQKSGYLYRDGMIRSRDGHCKAFDEDANGTLTGDGVGLVVLKKLEQAIADHDNIYAVIKGSAVNNDGNSKIGFTAPSVEGQARLISKVYNENGIDPDRISYIEAHGTGTSIGDPIEIEGLKKAFNQKKKATCAIGSVKSNIGHLNAAAGVAGFIKTVLALKNKQIPQSLHFNKPNPKLGLEGSPFYVQDTLAEWKSNEQLRIAGVSSFGIGGTNAHVALEEAPAFAQPRRADMDYKLLILSAKTKEALDKRTADLIAFIHENAETDFLSIIYCLQTGRKSFEHKRALICKSKEEAVKCLVISDFCDSKVRSSISETGQKTLVFVIARDSSIDHITALANLITGSPELRKKAEKYIEIIKRTNNIDLHSVLQNGVMESHRAEIFYLAEFLIKLLIAGHLIDTGAMPETMVGDAFGEVVFSCLNQIIDIEEAIALLKGINSYTSADVDQKILIPIPGCDNKSIQFPYISSVTGECVKYEDIANPEYWHQLVAVSQLPVRALGLLNFQNKLFLNLGRQEDLIKVDPRDSLCINYNFFKSGLIFHSILADAWLKGVSINWEKGWVDASIQKVSLPGYPFAKEYYGKYGRLPNSMVKENPTRTEDFSKWFYSSQLVEQPLKNQEINSKNEWLVIGEANELTDSFLAKIKSVGGKVIFARDGHHFEFLKDKSCRFDSNNAHDYNLLLNAIGEVPENIVLFLTNNLANDPESYFFKTLYLIKALGDRKERAALHVSIVTTKNSPAEYPYESLVKGVIKVGMQEYPFLKAQNLEVDKLSFEPLEVIDNHFRLHDFEAQPGIVLKNHKRYVESYQPICLPQPKKTAFKDDGVYVITGGLGGIGIELIKHISQTCKNAKLNIVTRSFFPSPTQWYDPELVNLYDEKTISKVKQLQLCKENGAEINVFVADVANHGAMTTAFGDIIQKFGYIDGIIHAAGVSKGGMIHSASAEDMKETLSAKVEGAKVIRKIVREELNDNLDFLIFFSSINAVIGSFGQSAYVAANIFLDQFAQQISNEGKIKALSINWDSWKDTGMLVNNVKSMASTASSMRTKKTDGGRAHHTKELFLSLATEWILNEHKIEEKGVLPATGFIEYIATFFNETYQQHSFSFSELFFLNPLVVVPNEERLMRIEMEELASDLISVNVSSKPDVLSEDWVEHAKGQIVTNTVMARFIDIEGILKNQKVYVDYNTEAFKYDAGIISFGGRWHMVKSIAHAQKEGLAFLKLNDKYLADLDITTLHPSMLDIATSFIQSVLVTGKNEYVPFAYKNLEIFDKLPGQIYSYSKLNHADHKAGTMNFSVTISDEIGKVLVTCEEFTVKKAMGTRGVSVSLVPAVPNSPNYDLRIANPGNISALFFNPTEKRRPKPDEVEIEVFSTGLNFKEVLMALDVLKTPAEQDLIFGLECAGVVTAKGENVNSFEIGDPVLAFCRSAFSKYVYAHTNTVVRKPSKLSFEEAASIPLAYLTAYYALITKGDLSKNDHVLIHAASGGVGLAAIKIAQYVGATVYATAGSAEKRDYLKSLGINYVFDSRTLDFFDKVKEVTGGRGVDMVLNSLTGEALTKGLSLLAPYGRFLEIGVRDILENNQIGMNFFEKGRSFIGINIRDDFKNFSKVFNEIYEHLEKGDFNALPVQVYSLNDVSKAFELMASAKHIGKLVLRHKLQNLPVNHNDIFQTGLTSSEGMRAIDTIVNGLSYLPGTCSQIIVSTHNLQKRIDDSYKTGFQFEVKKEDLWAVAPKKRADLKLTTDYAEPIKDSEVRLAKILADYLGIDKVGADDNLEELGMSSLDMIQINTKINTSFGMEISVVDLYTYASVKALAEFLTDGQEKDALQDGTDIEKDRSKKAFDDMISKIFPR